MLPSVSVVAAALERPLDPPTRAVLERLALQLMLLGLIRRERVLLRRELCRREQLMVEA